MLWLVPGLALTKSKINSGELTDKYLAVLTSVLQKLIRTHGQFDWQYQVAESACGQNNLHHRNGR